MKLNKLKLTNFRNHKKLALNFNGESSLIVGPNGIGKTNILEAIHLLSTTKSVRANHDREVIAHEENIARIEADIEPNGDKVKLEMLITKNEKFENAAKKIVKIDKVNKTLQAFAGTMNSVLFTPHDVELFTSSPSTRRKYVDALFFQVDRDYKHAHREYTKAVRQRNKVLEQIRDFGRGDDQIEFWNEKILTEGRIIQKKRVEYFSFIRDNIEKHAKKLNKTGVDYVINYLKNKVSKSRIEEYEKAEIASTQTLIGPHRDDFSIKFNGFDIAKYGSRGEKRATILALKLCEIDFINQHLGRRPILLLDDIFSELDEDHRSTITEIIDLQQTIVTSAEKLDVAHGLKIIEL